NRGAVGRISAGQEFGHVVHTVAIRIGVGGRVRIVGAAEILDLPALESSKCNDVIRLGVRADATRTAGHQGYCIDASSIGVGQVRGGDVGRDAVAEIPGAIRNAPGGGVGEGDS